MSHKLLSILLIAGLAGCAHEPEATTTPAPASAPAAAAPAPVRTPPKSDHEKTVLDVALGSPDHTTLVAAVNAAGVGNALASPGGIYTVFAPTNAAFEALPPGTVDTLLKPENKAQLKAVVQHHAGVPILDIATVTDGQKMSMADGTAVTFQVKDGKTTVDGANILGTVKAVNGVVYVVDKVIVPAPKGG